MSDRRLLSSVKVLIEAFGIKQFVWTCSEVCFGLSVTLWSPAPEGCEFVVSCSAWCSVAMRSSLPVAKMITFWKRSHKPLGKF